MKGIRTSSLFHYTNYHTLKQIIRTGLYPNYCAEDIRFDWSLNQKGELIGIPMVSFCDIPLGRIDEFADRYGYCAIGLKKTWADNKAINPVFYAKDSSIFSAFNSMAFVARQLQYKSQMLDDNVDLKDIYRYPEQTYYALLRKHLVEGTLPLLGYVKKYLGVRVTTKKDGKKTKKSQDNYLENEWRYIIPENHDLKWLWGETEYNKWRGDRGKPKPSPTNLLKNYTLSFTVDDISFIIVKTEEQVNKMISWIASVKSVGGKQICPMEVTDLQERNSRFEIARRKLISKVISLERIRKDY